MNNIKLCKECRNKNINTLWDNGYYDWLKPDCYECPRKTCGNKLIDINISTEEYGTIIKISEDINFIESMIKLHNDDIIEYQSRMANFKTQIQQQKAATKASIPKCPTCSSTNIVKISGLERGTSIAMLGLFSKKINKSFKCKNCGQTF